MSYIPPPSPPTFTGGPTATETPSRPLWQQALGLIVSDTPKRWDSWNPFHQIFDTITVPGSLTAGLGYHVLTNTDFWGGDASERLSHVSSWLHEVYEPTVGAGDIIGPERFNWLQGDRGPRFLGASAEQWGARALGLAGDVLSDPLSWGGGPGAAAATRGGRIGRGLTQATGRHNTILRAIEDTATGGIKDRATQLRQSLDAVNEEITGLAAGHRTALTKDNAEALAGRREAAYSRRNALWKEIDDLAKATEWDDRFDTSWAELSLARGGSTAVRDTAMLNYMLAREGWRQKGRGIDGWRVRPNFLLTSDRSRYGGIRIPLLGQRTVNKVTAPFRALGAGINRAAKPHKWVGSDRYREIRSIFDTELTPNMSLSDRIAQARAFDETRRIKEVVDPYETAFRNSVGEVLDWMRKNRRKAAAGNQINDDNLLDWLGRPDDELRRLGLTDDEIAQVDKMRDALEQLHNVAVYHGKEDFGDIGRVYSPLMLSREAEEAAKLGTRRAAQFKGIKHAVDERRNIRATYRRQPLPEVEHWIDQGWVVPDATLPGTQYKVVAEHRDKLNWTNRKQQIEDIEFDYAIENDLDYVSPFERSFSTSMETYIDSWSEMMTRHLEDQMAVRMEMAYTRAQRDGARAHASWRRKQEHAAEQGAKIDADRQRLLDKADELHEQSVSLDNDLMNQSMAGNVLTPQQYQARRQMSDDLRLVYAEGIRQARAAGDEAQAQQLRTAMRLNEQAYDQLPDDVPRMPRETQALVDALDDIANTDMPTLDALSSALDQALRQVEGPGRRAAVEAVVKELATTMNDQVDAHSDHFTKLRATLSSVTSSSSLDDVVTHITEARDAVEALVTQSQDIIARAAREVLSGPAGSILSDARVAATATRRLREHAQADIDWLNKRADEVRTQARQADEFRETQANAAQVAARETEDAIDRLQRAQDADAVKLAETETLIDTLSPHIADDTTSPPAAAATPPPAATAAAAAAADDASLEFLGTNSTMREMRENIHEAKRAHDEAQAWGDVADGDVDPAEALGLTEFTGPVTDAQLAAMKDEADRIKSLAQQAHRTPDDQVRALEERIQWQRRDIEFMLSRNLKAAEDYQRGLKRKSPQSQKRIDDARQALDDAKAEVERMTSEAEELRRGADAGEFTATSGMTREQIGAVYNEIATEYNRRIPMLNTGEDPGPFKASVEQVDIEGELRSKRQQMIERREATLGREIRAAAQAFVNGQRDTNPVVARYLDAMDERTKAMKHEQSFGEIKRSTEQGQADYDEAVRAVETANAARDEAFAEYSEQVVAPVEERIRRALTAPDDDAVPSAAAAVDVDPPVDDDVVNTVTELVTWQHNQKAGNPGLRGLRKDTFAEGRVERPALISTMRALNTPKDPRVWVGYFEETQGHLYPSVAEQTEFRRQLLDEYLSDLNDPERLEPAGFAGDDVASARVLAQNMIADLDATERAGERPRFYGEEPGSPTGLAADEPTPAPAAEATPTPATVEVPDAAARSRVGDHVAQSFARRAKNGSALARVKAALRQQQTHIDRFDDIDDALADARDFVRDAIDRYGYVEEVLADLGLEDTRGNRFYVEEALFSEVDARGGYLDAEPNIGEAFPEWMEEQVAVQRAAADAGDDAGDAAAEVAADVPPTDEVADGGDAFPAAPAGEQPLSAEAEAALSRARELEAEVDAALDEMERARHDYVDEYGKGEWGWQRTVNFTAHEVERLDREQRQALAVAVEGLSVDDADRVFAEFDARQVERAEARVAKAKQEADAFDESSVVSAEERSEAGIKQAQLDNAESAIRGFAQRIGIKLEEVDALTDDVIRLRIETLRQTADTTDKGNRRTGEALIRRLERVQETEDHFEHLVRKRDEAAADQDQWQQAAQINRERRRFSEGVTQAERRLQSFISSRDARVQRRQEELAERQHMAGLRAAAQEERVKQSPDVAAAIDTAIDEFYGSPQPQISGAFKSATNQQLGAAHRKVMREMEGLSAGEAEFLRLSIPGRKPQGKSAGVKKVTDQWVATLKKERTSGGDSGRLTAFTDEMLELLAIHEVAAEGGSDPNVVKRLAAAQAAVSDDQSRRVSEAFQQRSERIAEHYRGLDPRSVSEADSERPNVTAGQVRPQVTPSPVPRGVVQNYHQRMVFALFEAADPEHRFRLLRMGLDESDALRLSDTEGRPLFDGGDAPPPPEPSAAAASLPEPEPPAAPSEGLAAAVPTVTRADVAHAEGVLDSKRVALTKPFEGSSARQVADEIVKRWRKNRPEHVDVDSVEAMLRIDDPNVLMADTPLHQLATTDTLLVRVLQGKRHLMGDEVFGQWLREANEFRVASDVEIAEQVTDSLAGTDFDDLLLEEVEDGGVRVVDDPAFAQDAFAQRLRRTPTLDDVLRFGDERQLARLKAYWAVDPDAVVDWGKATGLMVRTVDGVARASSDVAEIMGSFRATLARLPVTGSVEQQRQAAVRALVDELQGEADRIGGRDAVTLRKAAVELERTPQRLIFDRNDVRDTPGLTEADLAPPMTATQMADMLRTQPERARRLMAYAALHEHASQADTFAWMESLPNPRQAQEEVLAAGAGNRLAAETGDAQAKMRDVEITTQANAEPQEMLRRLRDAQGLRDRLARQIKDRDNEIVKLRAAKHSEALPAPDPAGVSPVEAAQRLVRALDERSVERQTFNALLNDEIVAAMSHADESAQAAFFQSWAPGRIEELRGEISAGRAKDANYGRTRVGRTARYELEGLEHAQELVTTFARLRQMGAIEDTWAASKVFAIEYNAAMKDAAMAKRWHETQKAGRRAGRLTENLSKRVAENSERLAKADARWEAHDNMAAYIDAGLQAAAEDKRVVDFIHSQFGNEFRQLGTNKNLFVQDDLARLLEAGHKIRRPGPALERVSTFMSWARGNLLLSPGYHVRNAMGGYLNNMMNGVKFTDYVKVTGALRRYRLKGMEGLDLSKPGDQYISIMMERGNVAGLGRTTGDILDVTGENLSWSPLAGMLNQNRQWRVVHANRWAGEQIETVLRLGAGFAEFRKLPKGASIEEITSSSRAVIHRLHFDYSNLSYQERHGIRNVVPFWTWTSRNLPLTLSALGSNPTAILASERLFSNIGSGSPMNPYAPEWYQENYFRQISQDWFTSVEIPYLAAWRDTDRVVAALRSIPDEGLGGIYRAATDLNPFLRSTIEMMTQRDSYYGYQLSGSEAHGRMFTSLFPYYERARHLVPGLPGQTERERSTIASSWASFFALPVRKLEDYDLGLGQLRVERQAREMLRRERETSSDTAERETRERRRLAAQTRAEAYLDSLIN